MNDNQIQMYFEDFNERLDHFNGLVTYALDAVSKQSTEIMLLKQMVYYLNDTINSELGVDKIYEMMRAVGNKQKTAESDGDEQGDLLSTLSDKDKMSD